MQMTARRGSARKAARGLFWFIVSLLCSAPVYAETPFHLLTLQTPLRDVVSDGSRIYAAAYNRGEIWVYSRDGRELLAQVPAGRGPVALAISVSGHELACVNRLDNSVSLVALPLLTPLATVAVGESPTAVAALPDGRFAVADTFGDSVSIVDAAASTAPETWPAPAVPVAVAASGGVLAVAGRAANTLLILNAAGEKQVELSLGGSIGALEPLSDGRFVMATEDMLEVVGSDGSRLAKAAIAADALAVDNDRIYVASGGRLLELDASLAEQSMTDLATPVTSLSAAPELVIALQPAVGSWQIWDARAGAPRVQSEADVAKRSPREKETALEIVEAASAGSDEDDGAAPPRAPDVERPAETTDEPIAGDAPGNRGIIRRGRAEAIPRREQAGDSADARGRSGQTDAEADAFAHDVSDAGPEIPAAEESKADAPAKGADAAESILVPSGASGAPESPAAMQAPTPADQADAGLAAPARDARGGFQRYPINITGVRAPAPGRPDPYPTRDLNRRSITDALTQPTEFGSTEAGFEAPDWNQPLRDVEADVFTTGLDTAATEMKGNVKLRLGNMYLRTDYLRQQEDDYYAEGNILIEQLNSRLTADTLHYQAATEGELPEPGLLEPILDDARREQQRLTLGTLESENIHVIEPTREFQAKHVVYDFARQTGEVEHAGGRAGIYYFYAGKLHLHGPKSFTGEDVWITTCNLDPPHYKIRLSEVGVQGGMAAEGSNARLQLWKMDTPVYLPRWRRGPGGKGWNFDFDSGRLAEIGYYLNLGQRYELNPDVGLGPRLFVTEKEGVGLGVDLDYDFMSSPASRWYRSRGEAHALYTTKDRGYFDLYHRFEPTDDLVLRVRAEQWSDEDFYKDFFFDLYRDRTAPRTYVNVTYRQPGYIATGTARVNTHSWSSETERLPELTFHLLERPLADRLYVSYDTVNGYNSREPRGSHALRTVNVARLTYDWDLHESLSLTPFVELEASWYSRDRLSDDASTRLTALVGSTLQTRFHKTYSGRWGFSAFKHVVVPSFTYSYRTDSSMDAYETPRFDALDNAFGRSRFETKLSNVVFGRDAETNEVWQVGRLTLYQGNDVASQRLSSEDYEIEVDLRPRSWWGFQFVGERHISNNDFDIGVFPAARRRVNQFFRSLTDEPLFRDDYDLETGYGDYSRILAQLYYDESPRGKPLNGRLGFAYTETEGNVYNRELLYGLGYKLGEKWGIGFEHVYDLEEGDLRTQIYEIRRSLHCWETAIRFRDRESGFDVDLTFNIKAFPGSRFKL